MRPSTPLPKNPPILALLALCVLASPGQTAPSQPAKTQDLTGVLERVRQDVGHYELQAARWRGLITPKIADPAMPPPPFLAACPASLANYDFDITKIELTLQVVAENTVTADVGLKIPIGGASIGPDVNGDASRTMTKTIVLDRIPSNNLAELAKYRGSEDYANLTTKHQAFLMSHASAAGEKPSAPVFPISDTIMALRKSLLAASSKLPCFDTAKGDGVGNTIKFDFQVDTAVDPTIGFSFLVVSAKADDKTQSKTENTIAITIAPHAKPTGAR
jgi:hypothetical protein